MSQRTAGLVGLVVLLIVVAFLAGDWVGATETAHVTPTATSAAGDGPMYSLNPHDFEPGLNLTP